MLELVRQLNGRHTIYTLGCDKVSIGSLANTMRMISPNPANLRYPLDIEVLCDDGSKILTFAIANLDNYALDDVRNKLREVTANDLTAARLVCRVDGPDGTREAAVGTPMYTDTSERMTWQISHLEATASEFAAISRDLNRQGLFSF